MSTLAVTRRRYLQWPRFAHSRSARVGIGALVIIIGVAIFGPLFAPHDIATPVGIPGAPPGHGAPLGTDALGRDVLSRLLDGGRTVLALAGIATILIYAVGVSCGLIAGYSKTIVDLILMRLVDVLLSVPAILLLLVLVTGAGSSYGVIVLGVLLVLFPGVARIVRSATQEVSVRGYVEAAVARGETTLFILFREILPNIVPVIIADLGTRFSVVIIFIASLNFLSLGLRPPTADWGLMVSENRDIITLNVWAVLTPALCLALLTIAVNLVGDAYARSAGSARRR